MKAVPPISRVVLINDFSIARGGATTLVLLLLRLLRARNIPVTMIVGDDNDNSIFDELGVDLVRLGQKALLGGNPLRTAINGIDNRSASALLSDWIARNDTPGTVYHVHVWSQILSPAIFVPLRRVAERTAIHAHDFFHACPNGAYMDYRREARCTRVPLGGSCLATNCDRRAYAHKLWRAARQVRLRAAMGQDVPWGRIVLIHEKMIEGFVRAGYDAGLLQAVRNPALPFIAERIDAERNRSFFFIGRLEQEKGAQDALAAARLAGVPLEIIGDGPMRAELQAQYPEMSFHGWREQREIGGLIRHARGLVIPSRLPEPFGLVAAEAAASGVPIILTEMAFLADEIVARGMGLACNTQDSAAFAAALRAMADMPVEDMRRMSQKTFANGMKLANTQSDWVDGLLRIYGSLLHNTPAAGQAQGAQRHFTLA